MKNKFSQKGFQRSISSLLFQQKADRAQTYGKIQQRNQYSAVNTRNSSNNFDGDGMNDELTMIDKQMNGYLAKTDQQKANQIQVKNSFEKDEIQEEQNNEKGKNKRQKFVTMKDLLQNNLRNKQFIKKSTINFRNELRQIGQFTSKNKKHKQSSILIPPKTDTQCENKYENLEQNQLVTSLSQQSGNYSSLWGKFVVSVEKLQKNYRNSSKNFSCQQDRKQSMVTEIMKVMQYFLDQQDTKIDEILNKLAEIREKDIKRFYLQSHQLHQDLMKTKSSIDQQKDEYARYLQKLRQQQQQIKQQNNSKRSRVEGLGTKKTAINYSPLKLMLELNMNDKEICKAIEKKSKLNLQFDLSFQIQRRKRISKEKEAFQDKKIKLQKERETLQNKIKQIKQRVEFKEKQLERYESQKLRFQKERENFLKMLLKNPSYRLDGVLWTFRKMIEYGITPQASDFQNELDLDAKSFLLNEFNLIKQQEIFKPKLQLPKKKLLFSKETDVSNRSRVKSVILASKESNQCVNLNLNLNSPPKQDKGFFSFGSRNLKPSEVKLSIRKKSGSLTLIKVDQEVKNQYKEQVYNNKQHKNSFKSLMNLSNRKKIYESTKSYIKNWITKEGWNTFTTRNVIQIQDPKVPQEFISQQKARAKSGYFKIGRSNTKYKSIVRTLFGQQEQVKQTARRIKTSRQ